MRGLTERVMRYKRQSSVRKNALLSAITMRLFHTVILCGTGDLRYASQFDHVRLQGRHLGGWQVYRLSKDL